MLDIPQQQKSDLSVALSGKYKVYPASLKDFICVLDRVVIVFNVAMSEGK